MLYSSFAQHSWHFLTSSPSGMFSPYLCLPLLITTSYLYLALMLQSLLRILQSGGAFGIFASTNWGDLRMYYDFWNDYCLWPVSVCWAPHKWQCLAWRHTFLTLFSWPKPSNPQFNSTCSHAIQDREVATKRYLSLSLPESCALCISAWNHAKSYSPTSQNTINRKSQNLSRPNSPHDFCVAPSQRRL